MINRFSGLLIFKSSELTYKHSLVTSRKAITKQSLGPKDLAPYRHSLLGLSGNQGPVFDLANALLTVINTFLSIITI